MHKIKNSVNCRSIRKELKEEEKEEKTINHHSDYIVWPSYSQKENSNEILQREKVKELKKNCRDVEGVDDG